MSDPDHDTSIIDALLHAFRSMRRHYDERVRDMGLTMSRARVILALIANEGISQRELAAILEIEAPTLKRQLDGLQADGFIERRPVEGDARKNGIFLTTMAKDSQLVSYSRQLRQESLKGIDQLDLDRARAVLEQIEANVERLRQK